MTRNKGILVLAMLLVSMATAYAAGEITQDAARLNYWTAQDVVVTVTNTGALTTNATISSPWTVTATTGGCTNAGNVVECILASSGTGTYTVTTDGSVGEYATTAFTLTTNNSYTSETVTFVRMQDTEIFRTLVEYGRGRGNYFFDSSTNRKGIQCTDLPAGSDVELNYLHKIYPVINTYLNLPSAEGNDVEIFCTYPNESTIKYHLATNIAFANNLMEVNYTSDWLKTSWEKVFFLVQDFDASGQIVGDTITVNCSSIKYYLPAANGYVASDYDAFTLTFQNSTPLTLTATSNPATIGTGTSEVEITYVLNNTGPMTLSTSSYPVSIDIKAPTDAQFIGTRAEMWGTAQDIYHYEINSLAPGESVTLTLVAKYTTTGAGSTDLSAGAAISYVPCWQVNAYNPQTVDQSIGSFGTITVSGTPVSTMNLQDEVRNIENNITNMQAKLDALISVSTQINNTVNLIETYVDTLESGQTTIIGYVDTLESGQATIITNLAEINQTTQSINSVVNNIQSTVNNIWTAIGQINVTVNNNNEILLQVNGTTTNIYNYLQTEILNRLTELNITTQDTNVVVHQINTTTNSIQVTVNEINSTVNAMTITIGNIDTTVLQINQTANNVWDWAQNVNVTINSMQTTLGEVYNMVYNLNNTVWANHTAAEIIGYIQAQGINYTYFNNQFTDIDTSFATLTTDVRQLTEFEEESIYLVTDSITEGQEAYKQAIQDLNSGDQQRALENLKVSIDKLSDAEQMIEDLKAGKDITPEEQNILLKLIYWMFPFLNK